jgi:hypothetical protein
VAVKSLLRSGVVVSEDAEISRGETARETLREVSSTGKTVRGSDTMATSMT